MKEKKTPSLEQFYEELESGPDDRSIEQVRADLKELGINPEEAIARLQALVHAHLKDDRLAWKKEAAEKRTLFHRAKEGIKSWAGAPAKEIEATFKMLIENAKPDSPSFAFRNKTDLSLQDKARLLDSVGILRATSPTRADSTDAPHSP